jgi:hypothetical protein
MNDPQMADHCGSSSPTALARRKKCSEGCPKMQVKSSEKNRRKLHNSMAIVGYPTKNNMQQSNMVF